MELPAVEENPGDDRMELPAVVEDPGEVEDTEVAHNCLVGEKENSIRLEEEVVRGPVDRTWRTL